MHYIILSSKAISYNIIVRVARCKEWIIWMSRREKLNGLQTDIYEQLTTARNYLRTVDDFNARAAAAHNTTVEHYQVLLAVHCLGESALPLRGLADPLVPVRPATGQACKP